MHRPTRLARALRALSTERKLASRDLQEVFARRDRITSAMERLEGCLEVTLETQVVDLQGRLMRDLYLVRRGADSRMRDEVNQLERRLNQFDHEVTEPVRERLKVAASREKALMTLVERREAQDERLDQGRERKELDEFAQVQWGRRARQTKTSRSEKGS